MRESDGAHLHDTAVAYTAVMRPLRAVILFVSYALF